MTKHKKNHRRVKPVGLLLVGLIGLAYLIAMLLQSTNITLFNPKGPIALEQRNLMIFAAAFLLVIAIPTLLLLYFIAWRYRESNHMATYSPNARTGKSFVATIWGVPTMFMLVLAFIMWPATHRLEPRKAVDSNVKPLTVQVVAMRWKWVFIYPEQNIATVNYVQLPVGTPVQFVLTADEAPMSSFWIPHLGGQLYAMTGHMNKLNLMAEEIGDYPGSSAEINGAGFSGMKFIARASTMENFDLWVQDVKRSSLVLEDSEYNNLLKPSENNSAAYYSRVQSDLFNDLLIKYNGTHTNKDHE